MKIPFSPPDITEAEVEQVAEALRSGWITTGPKTKELEREVADLCGVNRAVCLNSQTACAEMTLRLLGIKEGDEVITCAYTYTASASVVCHVGAKLILIDTQRDCLEMDYYVKKYTPEMYATLLLPAGVTSEASIKYKDEAELLDKADDVDKVYVEKVLPEKMKYNLESIRKFSFIHDILDQQRLYLYGMCRVYKR